MSRTQALRLSVFAVTFVTLLTAGSFVARGHQGMNDAVVGVRPMPAAVLPATITFDTTVIAQALADQLAAASDYSPVLDGGGARYNLPPIDDTLTPRQREVLSELQSIGHAEIQNRLSAIAKAKAQINSDRSLTAYKGRIIYLLDGTSAKLNQLQVKIAKETLVDTTRADLKLVSQLRVYGLVLPLAHLLAAGYTLSQLSTVYGNQQTALQDRVYVCQSQGYNPANLPRLISALAAQVAIISRLSRKSLGLLQGLTVAGYPANRPSLTSAKSILDSGQIASYRASQYANGARAAATLCS